MLSIEHVHESLTLSCSFVNRACCLLFWYTAVFYDSLGKLLWGHGPVAGTALGWDWILHRSGVSALWLCGCGNHWQHCRRCQAFLSVSACSEQSVQNLCVMWGSLCMCKQGKSYHSNRSTLPHRCAIILLNLFRTGDRQLLRRTSVVHNRDTHLSPARSVAGQLDWMFALALISAV